MSCVEIEDNMDQFNILQPNYHLHHHHHRQKLPQLSLACSAPRMKKSRTDVLLSETLTIDSPRAHDFIAFTDLPKLTNVDTTDYRDHRNTVSSGEMLLIEDFDDQSGLMASPFGGSQDADAMVYNCEEVDPSAATSPAYVVRSPTPTTKKQQQHEQQHQEQQQQQQQQQQKRQQQQQQKQQQQQQQQQQLQQQQQQQYQQQQQHQRCITRK